MANNFLTFLLLLPISNEKKFPIEQKKRHVKKKGKVSIEGVCLLEKRSLLHSFQMGLQYI